VERIIFEDGYPDQLAAEMIKESGLKVDQYTKNEPKKAGG
jgi:hypothetical protein